MIILEFLGLIGISLLATIVVCAGIYCGAIIGKAVGSLIK